MPERLLPLLTESPQSGEALAARLGVGRVSVHTLAHALQEQGYPLVVSRRGYAFEAGTPAPGLTDLGERAYRYLGTVGSSQDELRAWAADPLSPAPTGAVVLAERQTAGRGRRGRTWEGGAGTGTASTGGASTGRNLTFSLLLPPQSDLGRLSLLPLAAGVALAEVTRHLAGVGGLKWPNDLQDPSGRKLAGLLLEADLRGEEVARAVLGVGLNVGSAPQVTPPAGAACLHDFVPGLRRDEVLRALLAALDRWLAAPAAQILDAWRGASVTLGRPVQVQTGAGLLSGIAEDIGPDGALLLRTASGELRRVTAGDVQLIGQLSGQSGRLLESPPHPERHAPTPTRFKRSTP